MAMCNHLTQVWRLKDKSIKISMVKRTIIIFNGYINCNRIFNGYINCDRNKILVGGSKG